MKVIGLRTILWRREAISRRLLEHYQQVGIELALDHEVALHLVAAHSDDEYWERISEGLEWWDGIRVPNRPLADKCMAGLRRLRDIDLDLAVNVGCDDFMSANSLLKLSREIEDGADLVGWGTAYLAHARFGVRFWPGYPKEGHRAGEPLGPGRALSPRLLDAVDWNPWGDAPDNNLDGSYWRRVRSAGEFDLRVLPASVLGPLVDVKDSGSLTPWHRMGRYNVQMPRLEGQQILEQVGLHDLLTGGIYE